MSLDDGGGSALGLPPGVADAARRGRAGSPACRPAAAYRPRRGPAVRAVPRGRRSRSTGVLDARGADRRPQRVRVERLGAGARGRPGAHRALRRTRASRRGSSSTSGRPRPSRPSPTDEPWDLTSNVAGRRRARRRVAARDRRRRCATPASPRATRCSSSGSRRAGWSPPGSPRPATGTCVGLETYGAPAGNIALPDGARRAWRCATPTTSSRRSPARSSTTTCCRSSGEAFDAGQPDPDRPAGARAPAHAPTWRPRPRSTGRRSAGGARADRRDGRVHRATTAARRVDRHRR